MAKYSVVFSNTADAYSYTCAVEPLGCDSLRFQMTFDIESFPLYVGGGISVGTLKFIKADADELRTIFAANALYDLKVILTNIASGVSWDFFADWSSYADDGDFVEFGLTITNLRERIKNLNIAEFDLSNIRKQFPITSKPPITNRLLWQTQKAYYFSGNHGGADYVDIGTANRKFFDQIKDGGTLEIFDFATNQSIRSCYLLHYGVADGNLDADTSVYINISGQLVFTWDDSLYPANPHDFCTGPQIEIRFDSYLIGATSNQLQTYTQNVYIQYPPQQTTTLNFNWAGVVPVYRSAPLASGQTQIYHVVTAQIRAHCASIQHAPETSEFNLSGNITIKHNIPVVNQIVSAVTMPDLISAINANGIFDTNYLSYFLPRFLLTTQFFSAKGEDTLKLKLEEILQAHSMLTSLLLYEENNVVRNTNWNTFVADCLDNPIVINHFYEWTKTSRNLIGGVNFADGKAVDDLTFFVKNYWNSQNFKLQNNRMQAVGDAEFKHNYIVDGQQIFVNLLKNEPTNKDIMLLWQDSTDIVNTPTGYINEYFSARRILTRLASNIYSRTPTHDNIAPTPTPSPQYVSTIPTDGGTPVDNQSAMSFPSPSYTFKPYKVKCKMLLTANILKNIMSTPTFSFEIDGKYYYPISMAIGLESDTYEVEMLEFE